MLVSVVTAMAVMACMIVAAVTTVIIVAVVMMVPRWWMFLIDGRMRRGAGHGLTVGIGVRVVVVSAVLIVVITVVLVGIHDSPYRLPRIGEGDVVASDRPIDEAIPVPFLTRHCHRWGAATVNGGWRFIRALLRIRRIGSGFPIHGIPLGGILVGFEESDPLTRCRSAFPAPRPGVLGKDPKTLIGPHRPPSTPMPSRPLYPRNLT